MNRQPLGLFNLFLVVISAIATTSDGMAGSAPVLLGSVATASPAETVGINGNTVYTCDNNEITVINATYTAAPVVSGTVSPPSTGGTATNTFCDVQRGNLVQMLDGTPS